MILTLEVTGQQGAELGAGGRKVFNAIGGTIGRLPDNDWVFPDPYVSGRHALVRYLNGKFFIEDTSTNGVYVNSMDNRLARAQPHEMQHGDRLYIDAYEILVTIEQDAAQNDPRNDPFAVLRAGAQPRPAAPPPPPAPRIPEVVAEDRTANLAVPVDEDAGDYKTQWFSSDIAPPGAPPPPPVAIAPPASPPPRRLEAVRPAPPPVAPAAPSRRMQPSAPAPAASAAPRAAAPVAANRPRPRGGEAADLATLLTAAGINGIDPSSEMAQTLGEVLRVAVTGLMEVLRVRERMKDELRMRGTMFKASHNNPLKFSANVDDAFHNMLMKHNNAYLPPAAAFEEAFHDLRDHQTAILAAMRLAFESMLAEFDPNQLQEDFDRQMKKGSILGVPAKLRYWDLYREKYGEMIKDAEGSFRTLFADQFAKAYEDQLERLRALARSREK